MWTNRKISELDIFAAQGLNGKEISLKLWGVSGRYNLVYKKALEKNIEVREHSQSTWTWRQRRILYAHRISGIHPDKTAKEIGKSKSSVNAMADNMGLPTYRRTKHGRRSTGNLGAIEATAFATSASDLLKDGSLPYAEDDLSICFQTDSESRALTCMWNEGTPGKSNYKTCEKEIPFGKIFCPLHDEDSTKPVPLRSIKKKVRAVSTNI